MFDTAVFLSGDSFPNDGYIEAALRQRLGSAVPQWIGQQDLLSRSGEDFDPDPAKRLRQLERHAPPHAVLIGRSSGALVASRFALRNPIAALICIGYPFRHPAKGPEAHRFAHLADLPVPTLILQGLRDSYGGANVVADYKFSASVTVMMIDTAHEFSLSAEAWDSVSQGIVRFLNQIDRRGIG